MQNQLDHSQFIRSLSGEQRTSLTRKSNMQGLLHLACHWGLILLFGWLIIEQIPYWQLLLVPQGMLIIFLFSVLHETSHRTAFKANWINNTVARICGLLLVIPSDWFRYFHFEHHRHTQDPMKDPELAVLKPETLSAYLIHISGFPLWRGQFRVLIRNMLGNCNDRFVPESGRRRIRTEAQGMVIFYLLIIGICIFYGRTEVIYVWVIPALLGQPFLRLYLLAEHAHCPEVDNMFENSRTVSTNWLIRKLAWNMPYHAEHHAYPAVPFHSLPALHELTSAHLQKTENGYVRFHRSYLSNLK